MDRNEILRSPGYWTTHIQTLLYQCADTFMSENHMNRMQLAEHLKVSKGYVSQLLNGDYDHRMSKMVELALAFGYVPKIEFVKIDAYISTRETVYTSKVSPWVDVNYTSKYKALRIGECEWEHPNITKDGKEVA